MLKSLEKKHGQVLVKTWASFNENMPVFYFRYLE